MKVKATDHWIENTHALNNIRATNTFGYYIKVHHYSLIFNGTCGRNIHLLDRHNQIRPIFVSHFFYNAASSGAKLALVDEIIRLGNYSLELRKFNQKQKPQNCGKGHRFSSKGFPWADWIQHFRLMWNSMYLHVDDHYKGLLMQVVGQLLNKWAINEQIRTLGGSKNLLFTSARGISNIISHAFRYRLYQIH